MSDHDTRDRFGLYRLCECPTCEGRGKLPYDTVHYENGETSKLARCPECRGEGRIRQEVASCATAEAVGVALVTLAREGEWEGCAFGLLDRTPECALCEGSGYVPGTSESGYVGFRCPDCKGSGVKPTGDWLVLPWLPSARNVRDAARTLARSKKRAGSS